LFWRIRNEGLCDFDFWKHEASIGDSLFIKGTTQRFVTGKYLGLGQGITRIVLISESVGRIGD
jgi:hypothetical protein